MAKHDLPNYHFAQDDDGQLAVEVDVPCEGAVTLTWRPDGYPGDPVSAVIPSLLFFGVADPYVRSQSGSKSARKAPGTQAETVSA